MLSLVLLLAVLLLPNLSMTAKAADWDYWSGEEYILVNDTYILLEEESSGDGWSYDGYLTLTLDNFNGERIMFSGDSDEGRSYRIILKGENTLSSGITCEYTQSDEYYFEGDGTLTTESITGKMVVVSDHATVINRGDSISSDIYVDKDATYGFEYVSGTAETQEFDARYHVAGTMKFLPTKNHCAIKGGQITSTGKVICETSLQYSGGVIKSTGVMDGYTYCDKNGETLVKDRQVMGGIKVNPDGSYEIEYDTLEGLTDENKNTPSYVVVTHDDTFEIPTFPVLTPCIFVHKGELQKYSSTKATLTEDGWEKYICSLCGNIWRSYIFPKPIKFSLSKTSFTYNGKAQKPMVTVYGNYDEGTWNLYKDKEYTVTYSKNVNVGKAVAVIKGIGNYDFTKTVTFKINPPATSIKSLKAASNAFTVTWTKKTTQVTGYQIKYSTSKSFSSSKTVTVTKNSTTSKKISNLKAKKKYYVKVRTYKTVSGTKYYSSWSSAKYITTK